MKLEILKKTTFIVAIFFLTCALQSNSSIIACPDDIDTIVAYANTDGHSLLSSDVLWGLFIVIFHIVIGIVHTIWREKKDKAEVK